MIKWFFRDNPSLLGDLLEERATGRSRAWYWRQIIIAIARSIPDEGRRHPILTLRAVATGLAVYSVFLAFGIFAWGALFGFLYPNLVNARWLFLPLEFIPSALAGWVMAKTHRPCIEIATVIVILCTAFSPLGPMSVLGLLSGIFLAAAITRHAARGSISDR